MEALKTVGLTGGGSKHRRSFRGQQQRVANAPAHRHRPRGAPGTTDCNLDSARSRR
jgi:hypothetical protein